LFIRGYSSHVSHLSGSAPSFGATGRSYERLRQR
jgi:hypothetical protein